MVASILSKKIAAGSTHLVLDIPVGPTAKVRSIDAAQRLRKLFEYVAGALNLHLDVMITDGSQPIGRGIGPVLEARDVMQVLRNEPEAMDLREKALRLAGRVIEFDPDVRGGDGWRIARDILESGRALAQMEALIDAQGRRTTPTLGELTHEVCAPQAGVVRAIDNLQLAQVARLAGAPRCPAPAWTCCARWAMRCKPARRCTASMPSTRRTWASPVTAPAATAATPWGRHESALALRHGRPGLRGRTAPAQALATALGCPCASSSATAFPTANSS
jgi:hypothetical protein